jgi:hypothetical protein
MFFSYISPVVDYNYLHRYWKTLLLKLKETTFTGRCSSKRTNLPHRLLLLCLRHAHGPRDVLYQVSRTRRTANEAAQTGLSRLHGVGGKREEECAL